MRATTLAVAVAVAGCEPTAPTDPSFQQDVLPILAANCVRCHGVPSIGGAPPEFRLDSFETRVIDGRDPTTDDDDVNVIGAAGYATAIVARVQSAESPMPPRMHLASWQIDTLLAWAAHDPPTRGEPRPGNQPPVLVVRELGRDSSVVTLAYSLHDPDGDLVVGELCDDDGARCRFVAPLSSGNRELRIDTTGFALPIALRARLDDGAGVIDVVARTGGAP